MLLRDLECTISVLVIHLNHIIMIIIILLHHSIDPLEDCLAYDMKVRLKTEAIFSSLGNKRLNSLSQSCGRARPSENDMQLCSGVCKFSGLRATQRSVSMKSAILSHTNKHLQYQIGHSKL
jgi:hypothetical protein